MRMPCNRPQRARRYHPESDDGSWRQRTCATLVAAHDHKLTHPDCEEYTVRTIKDNRVSPPRITQTITCDTCGEQLE